MVSLFAGIGGICLGFRQAGFEIVWANEIDHAACETYRHNFGSSYLVEGDIRKIDAATLPTCDVLAAGFPCQSFSIAGSERGFKDERGQLFFEVVRVVRSLRPPIIFLENVENLLEHDHGKTFQRVYTELANLGYILRYRALPTHEYTNIPQTRRRVYMIAFSSLALSDVFQFPEPIPLTVKAMDMIDQTIKQHDIYYYSGNSQFERYIRDTVSDPKYIYRVFNGQARKLTNGKFPTLTASMCTPRNAAVLRDMFGVRMLTLREELRIQGFPEDFYFPNTIRLEDAYRQIGNSVTVPIIRYLAERIVQTINHGYQC